MKRFKCRICGRYLGWINSSHLKTHGITSSEYDKMFPTSKRVDFNGPRNSFYGRKHTRKTKKYFSVLRRGKKLTLEHRRKIGRGLVGHVCSDKTRRRLSSHHRKCFRNGTMVIPHLLQKNRETDIERLIRKELARRKVKFESQKRFSNYLVDFYLLVGNRRIILEADGGYWHDGRFIANLPEERRKKKLRLRKRRARYLNSLGVEVYHLKGFEVRTSVESLIDKVLSP